MNHRHGNSVASLQFWRMIKLIIYLTMHKQKSPIYNLFRSKAAKPGKFRLTDIQAKPVTFFYGSTRASTLASAIILKFWKSFHSCRINNPMNTDTYTENTWRGRAQLHIKSIKMVNLLIDSPRALHWCQSWQSWGGH